MNRAINHLDATSLAELAALIGHSCNSDGVHTTPVTGLHGIRLTEPDLRLPSVYQPSICVIAQGAKQVLLEEEIYHYSPSHFLAISVDLPLLGRVTEASAARPYLCLQLELDAHLIADLLAQTGGAGGSRGDTPRGLFVGEMDGTLLDSMLRLARLLRTPQDIPVLAPLLMREVHYRLLSGRYGAAIAQVAVAGSGTQKIAQTIRHLRSHLDQPVRVEDLASIASMSPSSFHHYFKAVTAMSPLQYQKRLRLTEARNILLAERTDAATAAYRVGYQSVSQFSREYARLFGAPPIRDVEGLRGAAVGA